MRKKILAVVAICLIIVSFSLNVFSDNTVGDTNNINANSVTENKTLEEQQAEINQKLEESNTKLEYVQGEMGTTLQKVEELDDSVINYQGKFDDLEKKIESSSKKLDETNSKLSQLQDDYNQKETLLKKRVVALYEAGDTAYLDVLLSSKNIIEFISNYFMISELVEYDDELLREIQDTQTKLENIKSAQEQQDKELREAKIEVNKTKILLENTRIIKENYMLQLTDEEKGLQAQIEQYKAEQAAIEQQIRAAIDWTGSFSIQFTGGVMIWPIAMEGTFITSGYGNRLHPIQGVYKNHDGIDISGSNVFGAPVVAAADGIVSYTGWLGGYGNCVIVNHGSGIISLYGHGSEIVTQLGATVKQGDVIMKVGSTGNSTGPHLHFEIRKDGISVDPIPYLKGTENNITNANNVENNIVIN